MSVVIIVNGGGGRAALRRFEAAQNGTPTTEVGLLTPEQTHTINGKIADLEKMADDFGCPEDPCPE